LRRIVPFYRETQLGSGGLEELGSPRLELGEMGRTFQDDVFRAPRVSQVPHQRLRVIQGSHGIPIANDDEIGRGDG
jgi:hypothetical protein